MDIKSLKKLAAVAHSLDSKGYFDEAGFLDSLIEKLAKKKTKKKPSPKAKEDFDGDGEVETSEEEWKGSRDKAIKGNKKK